MGFLLLEVPLLVAIVIATGYYCFLLPPKYPENIPAIPFWVALLPFFKDVDQSDIFRTYIDKPLRKHGAVKLFFAAQWNVLVHRPAYMAEVFKDEDLFEKSGNQKKIPHSVLAQFLGKFGPLLDMAWLTFAKKVTTSFPPMDRLGRRISRSSSPACSATLTGPLSPTTHTSSPDYCETRRRRREARACQCRTFCSGTLWPTAPRVSCKRSST